MFVLSASPAPDKTEQCPLSDPGHWGQHAGNIIFSQERFEAGLWQEDCSWTERPCPALTIHGTAATAGRSTHPAPPPRPPSGVRAVPQCAGAALRLSRDWPRW